MRLILTFTLYFFISFIQPSCANSKELELINPVSIVKRTHAQIVIEDYVSAGREALLGLQKYPDSKSIWRCYIKSLAMAGDEKKMLLVWRQFIAKFPEEKYQKDILEDLAWGIIDNAFNSSSPLIRVTAMLGACYSQDIKGVSILLKGLKDGNSSVRRVAIKLSTLLFDAALQDEILEMSKKEKNWHVRLEAVKAIGELQIDQSKLTLTKMISNQNCCVDEKMAAIQALVAMSDNINSDQITLLANSPQAGLRLLACELVNYFNQPNDVHALSHLIKDTNRDVRAKIFQTIGSLRVPHVNGQEVIDLANQAVSDPDPLVAVTAAWVLILNDQEKGALAFQNLLNHKINEIRHLAAAALAAAGKYGIDIAFQSFRNNPDVYVRMNLSLGFVSQRVHIQKACECLFQGLININERWEFKEKGNFRILCPSDVKHDVTIPNYPEAVNQLSRLQILEILAILHYPFAQEALRIFLQNSSWELSGLASALLLTEGDDNAADIVRALLQDNDQKIRIQAALILALWDRGEDVVELLQNAYSTADYELKGQILEGIGRVGSASSVSFLVDKLQEAKQSLRVIAAASLLECLYH